MENIRESISKIEELSADELDALKASILSEYSNMKDNELTSETVETIKELAAAANTVTAEYSRREAEKAEFAAAAEEAGASISALESPAESPEAEAEAAVEEEEEEEIDPETGEPIRKRQDEDPEEEEEAFSVKEDEPVVEEVVELSVEEPQPVTEVETTSELSVEEPVVEETEETPATEASVDEEVSEPEDQPEAEASTEEIQVEDTENQELSNNTEEEETAVSNEELVVEVPEHNRPTETAVQAPVTITAGADIPGVTAGTPLKDLSSVAQALIDRRRAMGRTSGGDGEQHTVAVFNTSYPEDRILSGSDADDNFDKINKVTSQTAITAAGGLLAPVETSYDLFGLEENVQRPVKDSLAVFNADRGGIRFLAPVSLSDLEGLTAVWTIEDDIKAAVQTAGSDAEGAKVLEAAIALGHYELVGADAEEDAATIRAEDPITKPCVRVNSGGIKEAYIEAIPLCLTFGNLGARTFPEMVERHVKLGLMWHARFAEQTLITNIAGASTAVTTAAELGVGRDLLVAINKAAAGYRNRHRMAEDAAIRVILPYWLKDAVRADFTKQIPGDGSESSLGMTVERFTSWLNANHVNVTWTYDGESTQYFAAQEAGTLNEFPANAIWYLFAEGTFLFLDGGTLDLGIVRDSSLNATNDYQMFLETFEGVAKVGVESLKITTPVKLWGATAATVETSK